MLKSFFVLVFVSFYSTSFGQNSDWLRVKLKDSSYAESIQLITEKEYEKFKKVGFKFSKDYYNKTYFSNKEPDTLIAYVKERHKELLTIYSKDSIRINGSNKNYIIRNFVSKDRDRLNTEFKVLDIIDNQLFIDISGYEWWECIVVDLTDKTIDILPNLPFFLDKENMIIFNPYYGDEEFYFFNKETGISFDFILSNMTLKDYYIFTNVIYFKVNNHKGIKTEYLSFDLDILTKNK